MCKNIFCSYLSRIQYGSQGQTQSLSYGQGRTINASLNRPSAKCRNELQEQVSYSCWSCSLQKWRWKCKSIWIQVPKEFSPSSLARQGSGTRKVIGKYLIQNNLVQIRMLLERMLEFLKIQSWISKLLLDLRKNFHKQSLAFLIADFVELRGQSSDIWVPICP